MSPKYSLLNVYNTNEDATVDGYWVQDVLGSLEQAQQKALETEAANSNKINVVVVDHIDHWNPQMEVWTCQKRAA